MTTTTSSPTTTRHSEFAPVGDAPLLEVQDLYVDFHTDDGVAHAINGVSFQLPVSYTHLDVYKRQRASFARAGGVSRRGTDPARICTFIGRERFFPTPRAIDCASSRAAVSSQQP